jgi:hypothetical protein
MSWLLLLGLVGELRRCTLEHPGHEGAMLGVHLLEARGLGVAVVLEHRLEQLGVHRGGMGGFRAGPRRGLRMRTRAHRRSAVGRRAAEARRAASGAGS